MTQAFNLSQLANKVNTSGQLDTTTGLNGTIQDANLATVNSNVGSYTNASITVDAKGRITAASSGTGGNKNIKTQLFTSSGTWTRPPTTDFVNVIVVGAGGNGSGPITANKYGGVGGFAMAGAIPVNAPVSVTVGTGGGNTSSFGSAVSATGGSNSSPGANGSPGSGTVSSGNAIRTANNYNVGSPFQTFTATGLNATGYPTWASNAPMGAGTAGVGPGVVGVGGAVLVTWVE